jgi:hypothetical protein
MYPDVYRKILGVYMKVQGRHLEALQTSLESMLTAFPSHAQHGVPNLLEKVRERRVWEETTGGAAREISLVSIV